jgi:hypothetical protein
MAIYFLINDKLRSKIKTLWTICVAGFYISGSPVMAGMLENGNIMIGSIGSESRKRLKLNEEINKWKK